MSGSRTLKDAMNEALRDWVTTCANTFYCIGTVAGPHPYPAMVRDFQCVIGNETRAQMQEAEGRLPIRSSPASAAARTPWDCSIRSSMTAAWRSTASRRPAMGSNGLHAASIAGGRPGVLHGNRTYLLMDADGQIQEAHSISAGLDYPGIGPEHAWLNDMGRVKYLSATDKEALEAFQLLLAARRHHPGARSRACARARQRHRAEKAEGSPDGDQPVGPRRQGPRQRRAGISGQPVKFHAGRRSSAGC